MRLKSYDAVPPVAHPDVVITRLAGLKKGHSAYVYHTGHLSVDRGKYPEVGKIARVARRLQDEGRLALHQKPLVDEDGERVGGYDYIAVGLI